MKYTVASCIILFLLFSCAPSKEEQMKRDQAIADSVAKMLTGKSISDSTNIKRMQKVKSDSIALASIKKADAKSLKNISMEYDYDQKLFNKKSDIDGKLYNNSKTVTYRNFEMKAVFKDKHGAITHTLVQTVHITLPPGSTHKFTLKFEDPTTTKSATLNLIGAEEL